MSDNSPTSDRKNRRRFLKTTGLAVAGLTVSGSAAAKAGDDPSSFDPANSDEVTDYINWLDQQDDVEAQVAALSDAQVEALGDALTNVTWSFDDYQPVRTTDDVSTQAFDTASYLGKVVASVEDTTTEYIFEHRIDWSYDFAEYKNITSTLTPRPVGALAEYVNNSKEIDSEVRQDNFFIQRGKADFRLALVGRQVTSEVDVKGDINGDGETVKANAPL
jgi:hypothetical protein